MSEQRKSANTRRLALDPYVVKLSLWSVEHIAAGGEHQARFDVGGRSVTLDPFELGLLQPPDDDEERDERVANVTIESVALLSKCYEDLERLEPGPGVFAVQAELMLNSALGALLLDDTQLCIDDLIGRGQMGTAKALTNVRHRLRRGLTEVAATLQDSERERVTKLSCSLGAQPAEAAPEPPAPVKRAPAARTAPARRMRRLSPRRIVQDIPPTRLLAGALAGVLVVWAALFGVPRLRHPEAAPVLRAAELAPGGLVVSVEQRFPSLYGVLDGGIWSSMSDTDRATALDALGRELDRRGYRGALLRTADGRPAAQWLAESGATVLARSHFRQE